MAWRSLSDAQWGRIHQHLPVYTPSRKGGRPRADDRRCFEGILWVLWTGAPWSELPEWYGSPTTCWRRHKEWEEAGVFTALWRVFLADLDARHRVTWEECFADGTFASAKKGGRKSAPPSAEKARK